MAISLQKGGRFNLTKKEPSLSKIMIGLGWEMKPGSALDLDTSVFMLGENHKLPQDEYFVFYNNLRSPDSAVQHTGDNRNGAGEGDDEMILANLNKIDPVVSELLVVASIHDALTRNHHFGLLKEAYIRLMDVENNREILRYDLDDQFADYTEVEFGRLKRLHNEWYFIASGEGSKQGLEGYVNTYA